MTITIRKQLASIAAMVGTDAFRPALGNLHFNDGWVYAADGFTALRTQVETGIEKMNVPGHWLAKSLRWGPNKKSPLFVLSNGDDRIALTAVGQGDTMTTEVVPGVFPKMDTIFDDQTKNPVKAYITIDAKRLREMLAAMDGLGAQSKAVTLEIRHEHEALVLHAHDDDGNKIEGLVMAMVMDART